MLFKLMVQLLYWMYRLWARLLVAQTMALATTAKSQRVLGTNRGKVIDWRDANPCKDGAMAWQDDRSQEVVGSIPMLTKDFSREIYVEV